MKIKHQKPEVSAGNQAAGEKIESKRDFADRWCLSVRTIDNFLAKGLPHMKVGPRRVRIVAPEGDAWMRQQFAAQRGGPNSVAGQAGQNK